MVNGKTYPSTYQSANNMLRRMVERKELKVHELKKFGLSDMFMLPGVDRIRSTDRTLHEKAAADLFTVFRPYGSKWAYEPEVGKLRADRGMMLGEKVIYFEVDRMTEGVDTLIAKIDNYIEFSDRHEQRFHVIFVFVGDRDKAVNRGKKIVGYLMEMRRSNQFTLANHEAMIANPMGQVLFSPLGEIVSIPML